MKKVELILCFENNTWQDGIVVEISDRLWLEKNTDNVANFVCDDFQDSVTYIGVYNWDVDE